MSNRHHAYVLRINGADVERISEPAGKRYFCRACNADRCRHIKLAREADGLHHAQATGKDHRGRR